MAQNPLLGKRISLISKKNIRYEGLLYSINEQNATVALQNVRSYGTEGRELTDPETTFVATSDAVHPYLLFRGQDIKDLHVHENQAADETKTSEPAAAAAAAAAKDPPTLAPEAPTPAPAPPQAAPAPHVAQGAPKPPQQQQQQLQLPSHQQQPQGGQGGGGNRRQRKPNAAVGTGASLLSRKERGVLADAAADSGTSKADFDFQTHNDKFAKETAEADGKAGDDPVHEADTSIGTYYAKDDFFDSISCDALDKQSGVDSRLRGQNERQLNTETFGAIALNNSRRRSGRGGGGRGRGRGWGRGEGNSGRNSGSGGGEGGRSGNRGRGRGRGRGGGRSSTTRNNSGAGAQQSRYSES